MKSEKLVSNFICEGDFDNQKQWEPLVTVIVEAKQKLKSNQITLTEYEAITVQLANHVRALEENADVSFPQALNDLNQQMNLGGEFEA